MKPDLGSSLKSLLIELAAYAVLVTVYFCLVLTFLGGWLERLFAGERKVYAFVALGLIVGQGLVLEMLTRLLLNRLKARQEEQ